MFRTLFIKGRTGCFDAPSFVVSDNQALSIKLFFEDELRPVRYRLIVKHGDLLKTYAGVSNQIHKIDTSWLKKNAENIEFSLVLLNDTGSVVIKDDYQIEPLKIQTVNGNFEFSALVHEILARQDEQDERLSKIEEKLKDFDENGVPLIFE
jgi:hypothetical protein